MSTTDNFFGAVDPRGILALPAGALVEFTYDELGARRPGRYHAIRGIVRSANRDAERGAYVNLIDVTVTRPSGDVSSRPSFTYRAANIMALTILEGLAC